jgi:hypothetical protein
MTEQQEKAMRMALEALDCLPWQASPIAVEATKALRQALAQPEQEPFIYVREDTEKPFGGYEHCSEVDAGAFPVYTAPPKREWVGLTDEEVYGIANTAVGKTFTDMTCEIEAKLKEKNT